MKDTGTLPVTPIDLHVHSTKSDGTLTPAELVAYALEKGLTAIALTDHDTTEGIDLALQAARKQTALEKPLTVIPGIEFSTAYEGQDIHILGLFIDHHNAYFKERLSRFVDSRRRRNEEMCEKLRTAGIHITIEALSDEYPDGVITRSHIADYLIKQGFAGSTREAFERYIGDHAPCFIPRKKITPFRAMEIIAKAGGLSILAHPLLYHMSKARLTKLVAELAEAGLCGIEAVYSSHSSGEEREMRKLAAEHNLLISGGSDFHGAAKPDLDMGTGYGNLFIPSDLLYQLEQELAFRRSHPEKYLFHKFLSTDLDGTLLNHSKQISPHTRQVLDAWHQAGHRLVLNSGRDINSVKMVKEELGLQYPGMLLVGYNGAQIYDCDQEATLYKATLTPEQIAHIMRTAKEHHIYCHTYSETHIISPGFSQELEFYRRVIKTPVLISDDVAEQAGQDACKCLAIELDDRKKLEHFRDAILEWSAGSIHAFFSNPYYLELLPASVSKGAALLKLCEILHIPRAFSVAAGDEENDLSMLEAAGYSIAMCNGTESVKQAAITVTDFDNDRDGLAKILALLM